MKMPHSPWREGRFARWLPRTPAHLGRRGAILLVFGSIWALTGLAQISGDTPSNYDVPLLEWLPQDARGWTWVATGLIAVFHSFRPPGMSDALGFGALYIMPALRVVAYAMTWVDSWPWLDPWLNGAGDSDAWRPMLLYVSMVTAVMICAGWPEPLNIDRIDEDEEQA